MQEYIKKQIEAHDIISFDIFDTMLVRPYLEPEHLFKHIELSLNQRGFYNNRLQAEQQARKHAKYEDITIDDIYKYIHPSYSHLKEKELEFEARSLTKNDKVFEIYKYAKDLHKKIIFISDMYLPKDFLIKILAANGYDYFDRFFLSCEEGKAKYTGNLYKLFLEEFNVKPDTVLHFGDSPLSDVEKAEEKGLHSIRVQKNSELFFDHHKQYKQLYTEHKSSLTLSIILAFMIDNWMKHKSDVCCDKDYWYNFGYTIGGPIALGFTSFYLEELNKNNCKQWLFIARDSYWLYKITQILSQNPNIFYIYAQRVIGYKSLFVEDGINNPDVFISSLNDIGIKANTDLKSQNDKIRFLNKYLPELRKISDTNIKKYTKYLNIIGINTKSKIGIIDSGTANFTAQRLIERALGVKTLGLYTHIYKHEIALNLNCNYKSWSTNIDSISNIVSLIEFVLMAPEKPVVDIVNNKPVYLTNILPEEAKRNEISLYIGEGICDFIKRYKKLFDNNIFSFSATDVDALTHIFVSNMTPKDKKYLSSIYIPYDTSNKIYKLSAKQFINKYICKKITTCGLTLISCINKYQKYYISLFNILPIIVIKKHKYIRLFGIIPLIKIKHNKMYLFDVIKIANII